jgi:hypothetical protein
MWYRFLNDPETAVCPATYENGVKRMNNRNDENKMPEERAHDENAFRKRLTAEFVQCDERFSSPRPSCVDKKMQHCGCILIWVV